MTPAEVMCAAQCYDLLVAEAHPVEDVSDMVTTLGAIWQSSSWWKFGVVHVICAATLEIDVWSAHLLDRDHRAEDP